jgi:hypothetical protein
MPIPPWGSSQQVWTVEDQGNYAHWDDPKNFIQRAGIEIAGRKYLNFIPGQNVTITVTDDPGNSRVNVTIASVGGGGAALQRFDLSAQCDGIKTTFTTPTNYIPGTLWVWIQGIFQGVAPNAHYSELAPNQFTILDDLLESGVELVVAYIPA